MPGDLRVSLRLTAEDLMSPQIVEALTKLQVLEQATARINGGQQAAANGANAHAAAQAQLAEKAGASARALEVGAEAGARFGEEMLAGAARIGASLISFELVMQTYEKITEAAREAEVANRVLTARFGAAAGEYREFSEQVAEGTNFTAVQFERAAATLQPLIRDYGLTDEQLQGLLATTADLAAANRVDLVQASTDVVGVMRGMTRAGAELGLNLRTNVIASMTGLGDAEKRAVAEGDTLGGAQARLHAIQIEGAGAQGQAAAAAAETGDQFARLDGATAKLYETLADSSPVTGLAGDLADAAISGRNLLLIMELLDERSRNPEGGTTGTAYSAFKVLAGQIVNPGAAGAALFAYLEEQRRAAEAEMIAHVTAQRGLALTSAQAVGLSGTVLTSSGSPGVPDPRVIEENTRAVNALALSEQRQGEAEVALGKERMLTEKQYAAELASAMQSANDALARHAEGIGSVATQWERVADGVAKVRDQQLKALQGNQSQIDAETQALVQDRALRRRLGLPELAGETDLIRQLYKTGYQERLAEGPAAMQAALAHLRAGDWDPQRVQIERQDVVATNVYLSGSVQGGGGQQSSISDSPAARSANRYAIARGNAGWSIGSRPFPW
jgi:hypothetical protein